MSSSVSSSRQWPPRHEIRDALKGFDPEVLTEGPETQTLELEAARALGELNHFVAVSGGTQAIEIALRTMGIGPGDQVIVPAFTFAGTILPVLAIGAVPLLADVDPLTYNMTRETLSHVDAVFVEAVIPVHLHGLMTDVGEIKNSRGEAAIIEDSCQAYGAEFNGMPPGTVGDASCWSLNQTKTVYAGEGGLVAFRNPERAKIARGLRKFGFPEDGQVCVRYGSNWKLPEISARIARTSLRSLGARVDSGRYAAELLSSALDGIEWLSAPYEPPNAQHVYHKYRVRIEDPDLNVDGALAALRDAKIPACRWGTAPLHHHPLFREYVKIPASGLHAAEEVPERTLIIGHERAPLCSWDDFEASEIADRLAEVRR